MATDCTTLAYFHPLLTQYLKGKVNRPVDYNVQLEEWSMCCCFELTSSLWHGSYNHWPTFSGYNYYAIISYTSSSKKYY